MKRNLTSLNEQISRMKSLFTEERLYGNLVENEEVITGRVFLNEQDSIPDLYKVHQEQLKKDLLDDWNNMSKLEKMRYILIGHFSNHGFFEESFWSVDYDALPVFLKKLVSYGSFLAQEYNDHKPNTPEGRYFEINAKRIASPEEWMKFFPYTMGKIFDPTNNPNKFKDIKNKWKGADAKSIELLMLGAKNITDFDNFKGDMSVSAKEEMDEHNYWEKYYEAKNAESQERAEKEREEWLEWQREDERMRAEANQPNWVKAGFESADDYYDYLQGTGEYSWAAAINDLPTPLRWAVKGYAGIMLVPDAVYDILDCGDLGGMDYFHCIMGNVSMAVSVVPVLGTIASGIIDAVDAGVYLVEASGDFIQGSFYLITGDVESAKKELTEAAINTGWAGLSALGIIPGVTEGKMIFKSSKGVLDSADNIVKELSERGVKNMTPQELDGVINKHTKNLDDIGKKQVMEVMDELTNPNIRKELIDISSSIEDYNKYVDKFMKANKISKYQWKRFLNSPDFKKLMQKHGGDFYKAMKSHMTREVLRTFLWQAGLMTAIQGSMWGYDTAKKNRLEQDAAKGKIGSIVKLAGFDWDLTKEIFGSNGSIEDNELLKKAWNEGWTPWGINYETGKAETEPSTSDIQFAKEWLIRHPEYQTDTFKERNKEDMSNVSGVKVDEDDPELNQEKYETLLNNQNNLNQNKINDDNFIKSVDSLGQQFNAQKDSIEGDDEIEKMINFMGNN